MKNKQKKIQIALIISGILLIFFTYYLNPKMKKNKFLVIQNDQESFPDSKDLTKNSGTKKNTSFESLQYEGLYDLDKKFIIKSKKAYINDNEPDIVYMTEMNVTLYISDGRIVNILSDEGSYNKANYDMFFNKNVRATDGDTKIYSENLDLLGNESTVKIYNNVGINYLTGSFLKADKVEYDFTTKYFKVSMLDDKKVKMKIFK